MKEILLALYKKMYLIRHTESVIAREYHRDQMKTPMHMSTGEEGIVAGVCLALQPNISAMGTYRSHGLYLAITEETDEFFAEFYGKTSGVAGGRAGSMHLASPKNGLMVTSAVVGTTIPLSLGYAFADQYLDKDKITTVFFGDGAVDEGVFWESINAACLWKLPVIFVYEDNGLAIHTPTDIRHGYQSLSDIISRFNCTVLEPNSNSPIEIFCQTRVAAEMIKSGPVFISLKYYRYLEHVGVNQDFDAGYRSKEEYDIWLDPLKVQRDLLTIFELDQEAEEIEEKIRNQVATSLALAQSAPSANPESLYEEIYDER